MQYLDEKLTAYSKSDMYPFHMPGHKRKALEFANPYTIDITEITGFDNLHHAEGIIKEAQERAAALYGSERCFYLVNGSSCGLLAAICGATKKRDKVLVARNCHKAVYHALYLNEISVEYLYPVITENDLQGQITPQQIKEAFEEHSDIAAVVITSPTYEGILSDVAGIAKVAHAYGVPLIVDEAHGAHLGFGGDFPENAVRQGADAVIMSLHKTLPSFTQTALLHVNSKIINAEEIAENLAMFESSSPSYLLMAGMDACIRMLVEKRKELFENYRSLLNQFYQKAANLKHLHVMKKEDLSQAEAFDWDDSKIIIFTGSIGLTGEELYQILVKNYHLQMEMASGEYVLGMTSIMDEQEGLARLLIALQEIDQAYCQKTEGKRKEGFIRTMYGKNPREMQIYQAKALPRTDVSFEDAIGEMSADYIFLYPPGIPMIVPGEKITREFVEKMRLCIAQGLQIEGLADRNGERIKIVYF